MNIESNQSVTSQPSMSESQIEDVTSSTWKYIRTQYASYIIIYICICFVVIYLIPNQFTIYLLIMIAFWGYSVASKKVKSEFTKEFGKSIGFTYGEDTSPETVVGKLFKTGHSQSLSDVLTGVYKDIPIRIFTFCFTIGYGKNSHTYLYTVFEATLLGKVPDILLFSNKHTSAVTDWLRR